MADNLADIFLPPIGPKGKDPWLWGTVTQLNPLRVRLAGDSSALDITPQSVASGLRVGARVWCQFYDKQLLVLGSTTSSTSYMDLARHYIQGGGNRIVDSVGVKWSQRFILTAIGNSSACPDGYFDISMPPDGTVINQYGDLPGVTATVASGRIPLETSEVLWYEVPLGSNSGSVDANFRITYYDHDFEVPDNWIMICQRRSTDVTDTATAEYRWGDGREDDPWKLIPLSNSWVQYGSGFNSAGYRKVNGIVECRGLVKNGVTTNQTVIGTLPSGYRPNQTYLFPAVNGSTNTSFARLDVTSAGSILYALTSGASNGYLSLDAIRFQAEL